MAKGGLGRQACRMRRRCVSRRRCERLRGGHPTRQWRRAHSNEEIGDCGIEASNHETRSKGRGKEEEAGDEVDGHDGVQEARCTRAVRSTLALFGIVAISGKCEGRHMPHWRRQMELLQGSITDCQRALRECFEVLKTIFV